EEAWGPLDQGAGAVPGILGWDRQIDGPALDRGRVDRGDQFDRALAVFAVDQRGSSVTDRGDHIAQLPGVAGVLEPGLLLGQGVERGDQLGVPAALGEAVGTGDLGDRPPGWEMRACSHWITMSCCS